MATITRQPKNSATFSRQSKSLVGTVTATAGLYRGFGAFNYSGGEILATGSLQTITHQTKS